ncbi:MAG: penicillin-binding protein 1C [Pseudolabrys sp.]|nr:penicillin-binding protein 1C [Pseudolabrys sp.]MBV9956558.1 penicillin-binding protein 1C [Pseudolabrys sp.]
MIHDRHIVVGFASSVALAVLGGALWVASLGAPPLGKSLVQSRIVVDREARLLRAYAIADGRWRLPVEIEGVDPRFISLLLSYEDRRFYRHAGVDPLSIGRAAIQFARQGHVVSGGSTLTMQVARLLEPRRERSLNAKLRQMVRAIQIERALTKEQVLELYLNLAPYGGNIEGVRAAALTYFGKEARRLTLGEAALLVSLPQAPELRRPDRFGSAARAARDRVLDRAAAAGAVTADDVLRAKEEPVPTMRRALPMLAPHAADQAVAAAPANTVHRLTLDAFFQKGLEDLARDRARALGPEISVAIIAVDNASGEVRARVGSADFFDARRSGQVDMTRALRSPGSTLKPFIYGIAVEDGAIHPDTLIDDRPLRYGSYAPENFDLTFQGTVSVRKALQLSLNVPAIALLDRIGVHRLAARIHSAGAALVLPKLEAPGLAMGLGGVGITLSDLTMLYAGLARLGVAQPLTEQARQGVTAQRLLEPVAAWQVGNILLGAPPPDNAPPGRIAFKTGTSYGYRDAWSVGFDGRLTIGVWVGRADGAPVPGLIGRSVAAPLLFDAFARTGLPIASLPAAPQGTLIAANNRLPLPLQRFRPGVVPSEAVEPPRIMFPPNGARLEVAQGEGASVPLKVSGGSGALTLLVDGKPMPSATSSRRILFFQPEGTGFVRLTVIDAQGATDSVVVRMQ